jgi:hypothetical protein
MKIEVWSDVCVRSAISENIILNRLLNRIRVEELSARFNLRCCLHTI